MTVAAVQVSSASGGLLYAQATHRHEAGTAGVGYADYSFAWLSPVDPEEGVTASMGRLVVLLPEYHMNQRCSLSPK